MTFDIFGFFGSTQLKTYDWPNTQNTHPSATERQTLSNDVDAKYLEYFLRG